MLSYANSPFSVVVKSRWTAVLPLLLVVGMISFSCATPLVAQEPVNEQPAVEEPVAEEPEETVAEEPAGEEAAGELVAQGGEQATGDDASQGQAETEQGDAAGEGEEKGEEADNKAAAEAKKPSIENRFLRGFFNLVLLSVLLGVTFGSFQLGFRVTRDWRRPLLGWPVGLAIFCIGILLAHLLLKLVVSLSDAFSAHLQSWVDGLIALQALWITAAVVAVPMWLGAYLSSVWRMADRQSRIAVVAFAILAGLTITILGWPPKLGIDLRGGVILVYEIQGHAADSKAENGDEESDDQAPDAQPGGKAKVDIDKLIQAIGRRINPGGVLEVTIRPYGANQIEIIIPEAKQEDLTRIKEKISSAGTLEFRILANRQDHKPQIESAERGDGKEVRSSDDRLLAWWVPIEKGEEDDILGFAGKAEIATRTRTRRGYEFTEVLVVNDVFHVTGEYLINSRPGFQDGPCVEFTFNTRGGQLFGGLTGSNRPDEAQDFSRHLGIILDGYLQTAPSIRTTIYQRGQITGGFTKQEVEDKVDILNAGSLPATLSEDPIREEVIGPTLGRDTVERGKYAIAISMIAVLVFMLYYYRFAGVVACMALLMNLVLILAVMISIRAAFTLPGLAGLVLTVGMAVDANVLIFERIREELNRQASLKMAIRNGFNRATTTVVDANLTTLIVATVLYWIGTDQIKGFAVTLWLGVVLSMFTAIYCSRLVFDVAEKQKWITGLNMRRMVKGTQIDFIGMRRRAAIVSSAVILVGLLGVFFRGEGLLDIDFTGGVSVGVIFTESDVTVANVRGELSGKLRDLAVSDVKTLDEDDSERQFVINTSGPEADVLTAQVKKTLVEGFDPQPTGGWQLRAVSDTRVSARATFADSQSTVVAKKNLEAMGLQEVEVTTPDGNQSGKELLVQTSGLPQTIQVKQVLEDTFGAQLVHYSMEFTDQPAAGPAPDEGDVPDDEEPPQPAADAQSRNDLPGDTFLASADPAAVILAQATDASPEEPAAEEPAASADASEEESSEEPTEEQAIETEQAAETVREVRFNRELDHDTVVGMLQEQIARAKDDGHLAITPDVEVENEDYLTKDEEASYDTWTVMLALPADKAQIVLTGLQDFLKSEPYFPSSSTIGGKVASGTRVLAIVALLASLVCIVGYIWLRFQKMMFGLAAVAALVHDVLITLGVIALSAYLAPLLGFLMVGEFKIGLSVLAAFLTIIGYSLNDTIVVFDRIREVRGKAPELTEAMINTSINQTLSRTLLTSLTTLIVVGVLYVGGGQAIHAFAFSLVVGVIVGTYSSIFVASPALLWMAQASSAAQAKKKQGRRS